ncbi:hypothetical protein JVT61DRAFT_5876 [Boletus reticuloceps]|uniref:CHAT domain-containing protein n=1 Tax=Boletus reticuloceps TaxID=495285 RepID=A0A8I2YKV0_9AGAM|nr:hypothetical protein JVT61DRAFT_5876 [Boletus reticuloceps]
MDTDENEETMITSIRATNVTVGLRRLPAGFYTVVHHSGLEWRSENKRSSVNDGVVEWSGPIPIPSDLSATIYLEVYASFEFQPMLGAGEQLRELAITVAQLLDCSAKDIPFTLFPKDGDVVSPCSSILVTVRRGKWKISDLSASRVLGPRGSTTEPQGELEDATNQGHSALSRYRKHGGKRDLQRSIEAFQRALNSCPLEHPCRAAAQANLAIAKSIFCQVEDAYVSLEVPLQLYCNALAARPVGHFDRPSTLIQLAAVHFAVFERGRDAVEQAQAEALLHEVMEFSSTESHENRAATLMLQLHAGRKVDFVQADGELSVEQDSTSRLTDEDLRILSSQLLGRFGRSGDLADLQQAIAVEEKLVRSTPVWDDRYRTGLVNLGLALLYRFKRLGELSDLEDAISRMKHAVDLTPNGHPDKQVLVTNLGTCFSNRFLRLEEQRDLEDAISMHRDAVELTPHGHYYKYGFLGNLGNCFRARFVRLGELSDLEDAISRYRDAADLIPRGHPDKPHCLSNLGRSFFVRFERLYELGDLENATSMLRDAIDLTPDGHPDKPALYSSLASCFRARFERFGELSDLEEAVSRYKDAVDLTPDGHPDKPIRLNDLGSSISTRFERLGELSDLEVAISLHKDAVNLAPRGHLDKRICLHNLGDSLGVRYERLGKLSDLEDAISMLRDAVDLTPPGHPEKKAISMLREAIDILPHGHPDKPICLNDLGSSLKTRFQRLGELTDLENAISMLRDAIDLTPQGHPAEPSYLNNLAGSLFIRFERHKELRDLEKAISLYSDAASAPFGPTRDRFHASQIWIKCAQLIRHWSLFHAYSVAITLLPQLAWVGLSLTRRYSELRHGADVVREAAATALDLGFPETAVEWLEQGRSIVWGDLLQLRSSYEDLTSAHPDHARRLQRLSSALEHASATHERSLSALLQENPCNKRLTNALAIERDTLLQEIRGLPGFERFLLHKEFSQLRRSAHSGPIIILNAAESRCDALIVLADVDHVIHVPLPHFTFKRSAGLLNMMKSLLGHARVVPCDDRKGSPTTRRGVGWESLLSNLWNGVVKLVLDALAFSIPGSLSRIFWCPTGPFVFLPIHAAGFYDTQHSLPGYKVSDFVISSYIPTLSVLAPSPNPSAEPSGDLRLLTVRQPSSDGLFRLPGVHKELDHIKDSRKYLA